MATQVSVYGLFLAQGYHLGIGGVGQSWVWQHGPAGDASQAAWVVVKPAAPYTGETKSLKSRVSRKRS